MSVNINFVRSKSRSYIKVQDQLIGLVTRYLEDDIWTETLGKKRADALNITYFIKRKAEILMSHGVADKNYFFRRRRNGSYYLDGFEHAFVPGPWLQQRIVNHPGIHMPEKNIHVVGWPRLDMLHAMQLDKKPSSRPRVLWAPTHNRKNTKDKIASSYPAFEQYIPELSRHFDVDISLHPRNREDKTPTGEKLAQCDVLISDFGTTVYEAVALGIPVIFPDWLVRDGILADYAEASPGQLYLQDVGYHPQSFDEMMGILLAGPQLNDKTKQYVGQIIEPNTVGKSAEIVAEKLIELSRQHDVTCRSGDFLDRLRRLF